jgi:trigger factor
VNIEVQDVSPTRKTLTISLDAAEVDAEHAAIVSEFAKHARVPGFRPGKAPPAIIARRFGKEIAEEFRSKVLSKAYREGLDQAKLDVLAVVNAEEGQVVLGQEATLTVTVDLRPTFELPNYKGIATQVAPTEPTAAEIDAAIEGIRSERADFKPVERATQKGDFVKLAYEGTIEGRPIVDLVPERQIFGKVPQTWEEVAGQDGLIPGLAAQLLGLAVGAKKDVTITFPSDFNVAELAGKIATYAVEVLEVRERVLPEIDEAFLKAQGAESLEALRADIKRGLTQRKEAENRAAQRRQVTDFLSAAVDFPVPETLLESETQSLLRNFMEENMRRGVSEEEFEKNKEQLYAGARQAALQRAKIQLLLARIAEVEKLEVNNTDLDRAVRIEAMRSGQRADKIAKDLSKDRDRLRSLHQSLLLDKALDFVVTQATVATSP